MAQAHLENEPINKSFLNQKGSFLLILGVIVIILVVLGVGGYSLIKNKNSNSNQYISQPTPTSTQQTSSNETANWKIYTSNTNGYSLKYPVTWETYGYGHTSNDDVDVVGERFFRPIGQQNSFAITIRPSLAKETSYAQAENFIKGFFDNGRKISSITVDGVKGTKVEGQTSGQKQIIAIFTNNKVVIEIQAGSLDGVEKFDQILSAFKFTEQNQTGSFEKSQIVFEKNIPSSNLPHLDPRPYGRGFN